MAQYMRGGAKLAMFLTGAGAGAGAYAVSDLVLHPSWQKHRQAGGELHEIKGRRVQKFFLGKVSDPMVDFGKEFEVVAFDDEEDTDRGWYIPCEGSETCIVGVHGAGNDRREMLKMVHALQGATQANIMLFDCMNHGSHGGTSGISLGVNEHVDVVKAVKYVRGQKHNKKVFVMGTSQGAAATIMAAARHGRDVQSKMDALVLENPFADGHQLILRNLYSAFGKTHGSTTEATGSEMQHAVSSARQSPMMSALFSVRSLVPAAYLDMIGHLITFRVGLSKDDKPLDLMPKVNLPVMFMHGTDDHFVPITETLALKEAHSSQESNHVVEEWYPNSTHSMLFATHPEEFTTRVGAFLASV